MNIAPQTLQETIVMQAIQLKDMHGLYVAELTAKQALEQQVAQQAQQHKATIDAMASAWQADKDALALATPQIEGSTPD